MQKKDRHDALLALVRAERIASQDKLASKLCDMGFTVTQASVSRDLDELGVVKLDMYYTLPEPNTDFSGFGTVSFSLAGNCLIVGRCSAGLASAITVGIDAVGIQEIVGTIAGDDTIFIAVRDVASQSIALERVISMFS